MLRLMLAVTIVLLPNLLYFSPSAGIPGLNPANAMLLALLVVLGFSRPASVPVEPVGALTAPLLAWFAALAIAFGIAAWTMPLDLMGDLVHLKNIAFYPLLYFVYRRCRLDLAGTRQLILLTLAVAVAAGVDAAMDGLSFDTATYSDAQRTAGPFGEKNASNRAGVFYAMFLPMLAAVAIFLRGRPWLRLLALAGCGVLVFAIMVTFSRQAYLIAMVTVALLLIRRNVLLALLLGALAIPAVVLVPPAVVERVTATQHYVGVGERKLDESTASRFEIWAGAMAMWKDHPAGVGLNRFPRYIGRYSAESERDAHSVYVLTLAECGPLGVAALLWLLWRLLRLGLSVRWSGGGDDIEAKTLGIGFTVAILAMALGNVYGSPLLDGLVMGNFWILCGLLERYASLKRHAAATSVTAAEPPPELSWQIGRHFPLAARILPGHYPSPPQ